MSSRARAPVTLALVFGAIALAYAVAIPLGALSAASQGRRSDSAIAAAVLTAAVLPTAVVAVAAVLLLGRRAIPAPADVPHRASLVAAPTRQQRAALVAILTQDFVRAARARGAGTARAIAVHGLRNAVLPVVTLAMLEPPMALGGAFVVERVLRAPRPRRAHAPRRAGARRELAHGHLDRRRGHRRARRDRDRPRLCARRSAGRPGGALAEERGVTHATAFLRRMVGSKRVAIGAVLLGVLALLAIFAELLAAPAPIACFGPRTARRSCPRSPRARRRFAHRGRAQGALRGLRDRGRPSATARSSAPTPA